MRWLSAFFIFFACSTAQAAPAALPDLLDMPAEIGEVSMRGLVLDITRAGDRLVAVGGYGVILFSDDDGESWRQAQVPVQSTLTAVHFPTAEKGWAVGHDAVILHSDNRGETWTLQLDGRQTGDILVASAEAWVARLEEEAAHSVGIDEDLMMSQDAALMALDEALREQEIGPNRPLLDVYFIDESTGYALGAFNYFFVTKDGGRSWEDFAPDLPNPEMLHLYNLTQQSDGSLIVVGEFGLLLRSPDGIIWETLKLDYEGTLFQATSAEGRTWAAGLRGNIFYSDDAGDSWEHLPLQVENSWLGATALPGGGALLAGLAGALLQVEGGATPRAEFDQVARVHLASVIPLAGGFLLLAGEGGLMRLDSQGRATRPQYLGGVN